MNIVHKFLFAINFFGFKATFLSFVNSINQWLFEKKYVVPSQQETARPISLELLESVKPFHNGAYFLFNDGIQLEVSFLSTHSARITWTPGLLPQGYAVSGDETIALKANSEETELGWLLTAGSLEILVHSNGVVEYLSSGKTIRKDAPPVYEAPHWSHSAALAEEAVIHGLGERTRFNLRPGNYRLWNNEPGGTYGLDDDPLYLTIPVYYCRQHAGGYLAFYENSHDGEAQFGEDARFHFVGGALRVYVLEGDLPNTLEEYSRLTGRAPIPPRWALGFHHCRWGYQSSTEVRVVLEGFKQHDLPLDSYHFDIDYMDGYRVFSVDPVNYADFEQLCGEMLGDGIKPVVILDPGVKVDPVYGVFSTGLKQDVFCKLPNGKPVPGLVWPGNVNFPDFSNPVTRKWWGEYYQRMVEDGVAGFWHDMNEPAAFVPFGESTLPRWSLHHLEGRGGNHVEVHNLYGLLMNMAGFEALRSYFPHRRPWLLTRSGWAGVQRYAWTWTADVESTWPALKMTISTVLGLGISGIPYSGSDIGGFSGNPDAELYARWFQMSTLMAFFRNHAAIHTQRREPWVFGEDITKICREMLSLRKRLLPYLYTLAWEAQEVGAPFVRPLSWLEPDNQQYWSIDDSYLLGDKLLVAPVVEAGERNRKVLLPRGGWYHYWDDTYYPNSGEVEVPAPLNQIPLFVQEGSVIPILDGDRLALHIYFSTHLETVHSYLYEDAGDGYGVHRLDRFILRCNGNHLSLDWQVEGDYQLPEKILLVLHGGRADTTKIDGKEIAWDGRQIEIQPFKNLKAILQ